MKRFIWTMKHNSSDQFSFSKWLDSTGTATPEAPPWCNKKQDKSVSSFGSRPWSVGGNWTRSLVCKLLEEDLGYNQDLSIKWVKADLHWILQEQCLKQFWAAPRASEYNVKIPIYHPSVEHLLAPLALNPRILCARITSTHTCTLPLPKYQPRYLSI